MLIAARNGFIVGGWKNPYPVMDACTNWWSGEWNAGGGKHSANADIWKDLVGNIDLTVQTAGAFSDKSLVCDESGIAASNTSQTINPTTIEIVFADSKGYVSNDYNTRVIFSAYQYASSVGKGLWLRRYNGMHGVGYAYKGFASGITKNIEYFAYNFATEIGYKNATSQTNTDSGTKPQANVGVFVGSSNNSSFYFWSGQVLEIRCHSRSLTADEIAHNYAVDKARFNLP